MATTSANARPRPRTQAQRRAETRAKLDATIECLVTYGYAGTTTVRIAEVAGVSRGAQIPYFRSRSELVRAALAHLAERRAETVDQRLAAGPVSIEELLDVLWDEHQGPIFDATLELWVAARTDPDLRKSLRHVEREVAAGIHKKAVLALGDQARLPGYEDDLIFALATIRGLALLRISNGASSKALAERWAQTRDRLARVLA